MPWIESHTVLLRHRKLKPLAFDLRLKPVYVLGHLHALWHVALEQAEDGDLSHWTDEFIADSACYSGDPQEFVRLLQKHKWLDGRIIHDWLDYAGRYLEAKYRTSNPERLKAIKEKHEKAKSDLSQTLDRPPYQPDQPNQHKEKTGKKQPAPVENLKLKSLLEEVNKSGFNIYQLIGKFRKEAKKKRLLMFGEDYRIPDEILIKVAESYLKNKAGIKGEHFPWVLSAISKASTEWWVSKQDAEHLKIKTDATIFRGGDMENLQDILKRMMPEGLANAL